MQPRPFGSVLSLGLASALLLSAAPRSGGGDDFDLFLDSTLAFDAREGAITLPLHRGFFQGEETFYVLTASSSRDDARARGLNWAPRLKNALGHGNAVQHVGVRNGGFTFVGSVDFSPERVIVPGPLGFPPDVAKPGSVGDARYSALVTTGNGVVLNAPIVANRTGVHDSVAELDIDRMTVTFELIEGRYHDDRILYISTEASDPPTAALEASTYAPAMNDIPGLGSNDERTSARAAIVPFVNGATGRDNPDRQGLNSALLGEGSPLNVTEIHPRNRGKIPIYSPIWDVHPAVWTENAIRRGERQRIEHHEDIADLVEDGWVVSGGNGPRNPELGGLRAGGFIVNCPIMAID